MNRWKRNEGGVLSGPPYLVRLVAGCLVFSLVACGAPVSEKAPGQTPKGSGGATVSQNARGALSTSQLDSDTDERDNLSIPGVPDTVARGLSSVDARDRYRALEHWVGKGVQAPMDPVFEAMEDEDEDVREKATAIVEQWWAEEQKKEQG